MLKLHLFKFKLQPYKQNNKPQTLKFDDNSRKFSTNFDKG